MDRPNPWLRISFFDVLWLNGRAGSLLFCMWTVRKPADIFDVTEINGASEPEALQLSIPLSSRLKTAALILDWWE